MDCQASPSKQGVRQPLLVAGCSVVLAMGLWYANMATSPVSSAHVQTQPRIVSRVASLGHMAAGRKAGSFVQPTQPAAAPLGASKVPPPVVLEAAGVGASVVPWLSIAAIVVSIGATIANFLRRPQPVVVSVAEPYQYRANQDEGLTPVRSNKMDEVAMAVKSDLANRKHLTPKQVVLELQRGNARFWSGTPLRPEIDVMERRALIIGQAPSVCILSCADSRVPVEILFDQGLGSVFVVRVAGNILDATATGSIEFSVKYLGVKVLLVMGHEACGAVKGAMSMSNADLEAQPAYLQSVLRSIKSNLNLPQLMKITDNRAQDREAVVANVSSQVKRIQENKLIAERVANGSLLVCGAFYEMTSGIVDFFTLDKNGIVIDV